MAGSFATHVFYRKARDERKVSGEEKDEIFRLTGRLSRACKKWRKAVAWRMLRRAAIRENGGKHGIKMMIRDYNKRKGDCVISAMRSMPNGFHVYDDGLFEGMVAVVPVFRGYEGDEFSSEEMEAIHVFKKELDKLNAK